MREFAWHGGGGDAQHSAARFLDISKIFVTQNSFFNGTIPFDRVEWHVPRLIGHLV